MLLKLNNKQNDSIKAILCGMDILKYIIVPIITVIQVPITKSFLKYVNSFMQ